MRIIYSILVYLLLTLLPFKLLFRSIKEPTYRQNIKQRYGFVPRCNKGRIWIHCISVGESIAAKPLILQLVKNQKLIITCTTASGRKQLENMFPDEIFNNKIIISYIPIDYPLIIKYVLKQWQPSHVIFVETDIWPNICKICHSQKIRLSIINARMSDKSFLGYSKLGTFFANTLKCFNLIAVQYEKDAHYFLKLGAKTECIKVTGSIKADLNFDKTLRDKYEGEKRKINRPVWISASTHSPEEKISLDCHKEILKLYPNALLILVPRHPNRFVEVENLIRKSEFVFSKRTDNQSIKKEDQVFLADSIGELMNWLILSDVVFMGKSMGCNGGHNPLEAAYLAKPIVTGKGTENFQDIYNVLKINNGALIINSPEELFKSISNFFNDPHLASTIGVNARETYDEFSGALNKTLTLID
ncbi:3-deoxy-D-manno-octulosonic acid transferase [Marinicellulosiphila megalodicopiae]|uniref:3-deoxy-D-manno-octulosonic acid transferase n=1 Tax=Marinicellulosiphila megalodicopiae TaxID=2724896 RepID=UPI003BB16920